MWGAVFAILLCMTAGAMFLAFHTLYVQTTRVRLTVKDLPPLTLIHITDLHGRIRFLNGSLHQLLNRWEPDMLFVTGDLAQKGSQLARVMDEIARIRAKQGIYFVPGNYEREEMRGWRKRMYSQAKIAASRKQWQSGMNVLENEEALAEIGSARIRVYGFDNSKYGNERYRTKSADARADFTVLLAHSPNIHSLIRQKEIRADLLLTGHTHGGQVRLFGKTFGAYKHFHVGQKKDRLVGLFSISRGLGTSRLPLRLNCFPEITVYLINQPDRSSRA